MACPNCECRTTYPYYEDEFDSDTNLERCANCGFIFDIEDSIDEDDEPMDWADQHVLQGRI